MATPILRSSPLPMHQPSPGPAPLGRTLPVNAPAPPSYPLVAGHIATALAWFLLGSVLLVPLAGQLATGNFLDPRVLALTHIFTLGWLVTVITGVLYQIVPALMGAATRSNRVAWWSYGFHLLGTCILVHGLWTGWRSMLGLGYLLLFAGVYGHAWNILPARKKANRNKEVGIAISYAHIGLGNAMAVAGARIGDAFGWWTTPRLPLLASHFTFALVGFGTITAMGVGSRMLPMFLGAIEQRDDIVRGLRRALASGTVLFALGAMGGWSWLAWAGALAIAGGIAFFAGHMLRWYGRRSTRRLDPTTSLALAALLWLVAGTGFGLAAVALGLRVPGFITGFVVTMLLGWLSGLTIAVSFRILATLTWHYRFARQQGKPGTPQLADLVHPPLAWAAGAGHTLGMVLLVASLFLGNRALATAGAAVFLAGLLAAGAYHVRLFLVRPAA